MVKGKGKFDVLYKDWADPKLPANEYKLAACLWSQSNLKGSLTFKFSYAYAEEYGIGPQAAVRNIEKLAKKGLISVTRGPGRSPQVTIILPKKWET